MQRWSTHSRSWLRAHACTDDLKKWGHIRAMRRRPRVGTSRSLSKCSTSTSFCWRYANTGSRAPSPRTADAAGTGHRLVVGDVFSSAFTPRDRSRALQLSAAHVRAIARVTIMAICAGTVPLNAPRCGFAHHPVTDPPGAVSPAGSGCCAMRHEIPGFRAESSTRSSAAEMRPRRDPIVDAHVHSDLRTGLTRAPGADAGDRR